MLQDVLGEDLPYLGAGVSDRQAAGATSTTGTPASCRSWRCTRPPAATASTCSTAGSDMAWISPTWSPEYGSRRSRGCIGPGQTRPVMVRVCVATDTVDDLKLDRVHHKMTAQEAFEAYLRQNQKEAVA